MTTGRPLTAKCRSKCCAAVAEDADKRSTAQPSNGNIPRPLILNLMLVFVPPAIHHDRYQFRLLLIGAAQILPSQLVLRLFFHTLLAIENKFVDDVQILAEGNVHTGTASQLHGRQMSLIIVQGEAGVFVYVFVR